MRSYNQKLAVTNMMGTESGSLVESKLCRSVGENPAVH